MKFLASLLIGSVGFLVMTGCNSSAPSPASFCDTVCVKDTIRFQSAFKLKPYVYISANNCIADTILWSYSGMGVNRKLGLADILNTAVRLNPRYVRCVINDTSWAWLLFNDCRNGRGYSLRLPFKKVDPIGRKSSSINSLDPKFSIADNIVAFTDRGNIYIEDMMTAKKAMMTFGEKSDIDYDAIHESIDSVNVTNNHIWVKVKIGSEWRTIEKNITLQ